MRTLVSCFTPVILNSILKLEKEGYIEFINIMCEQKCNHSKNISRLDFLNFEYSENTLNLIKKYSDGINYDENIYSHLYKNMYKYINNIGRHNKDFQYVSETDYIHCLNLIYKFLYGYLKKERIELVIFDHTPHAGFDDILYDLCTEFGIKTIILQSCVSPITNIPFLLYTTKMNDGINFNEMNKKYREPNEKLVQNYNHFYMKGIKEYEFNLKFIKRIHVIMALFKGLFSGKIFTNSIIKYVFIENRLKNMRKYPMYFEYKYCLKKYTEQPDYSKNYVYFPLHLQPELTTSVNGGIYCDQLLAIERLSKLLPEDWFIYVKENPKQNEYMRGRIFFKRLSLIKNVKFIDVKVPSSELLNNCKFCATIDGTASFESICGGKPTLIFGKVWWDFLPGVFHYKHDLDINEILNYKIDKNLFENKYNEYLSNTIIGTLYNPTLYKDYYPALTCELNDKNIKTLLKDIITEKF